MSIINTICDDHRAQRYDRAWTEYERCRVTEDDVNCIDVWEALDELKKRKIAYFGKDPRNPISNFSLMFDVCGKAIPENAPLGIYNNAKLEDRMGQLIILSGHHNDFIRLRDA